MIGEATLTDQELNKVLARLEQGHNVEVTAIHKHLQNETPRLWWVHYAGYGDPVAIARILHAAFALTGMPLTAPAETEAPIALDTAALDRIVGGKGVAEHGVYQYTSGARERPPPSPRVCAPAWTPPQSTSYTTRLVGPIEPTRAWCRSAALCEDRNTGFR